MEVIILAGGFGTRLRSVVNEVPKCMAPIANKPFLWYLLKYLTKFDVSKVILSLGYLRGVIIDWIDECKDEFPFAFEYAVEDEPLGTGGGIKLALKRTSKPNIIVLNGDTFFDVNLNELYEWHCLYPSSITLALKPMENFDRYGNVQICEDTNQIRRFDEKKYCEKGLINGGIYNLLNDEVAITDGGTLNFTVKKYKPIGASDDTTVSVDEKEIKDILDVKEMDSSTISKEDNELFNKAMGDKYKVAGFYDINLFKGLNDDLKFEEVLETSDKVKVTLSIPTALPQVAEGYKRTYYVIRLHNGKTDILDTTLTDDNKVSFETDKFSSYALAYVDEKVDNTTKIENPNTSDKALIYGVISLIGLSGLVYTAKVLKRRS